MLEAMAPRRGGEEGAFLCLLSCRTTRKSVARRGELPAGQGMNIAQKHSPAGHESSNVLPTSQHHFPLRVESPPAHRYANTTDSTTAPDLPDASGNGGFRSA